jgi:dUTP pyrophosphatase
VSAPQGEGTAAGEGDVAVPFRRLHPAAQVPRYAHAGDAGADLCCCEAFTLGPGERRLVGTGLAVALPEGYAAFVHPRSGLAARFGVTVVNAPGTVDAGYRGEIQVCLLNTDRSAAVSFAAGDRIAQLVLQRVARAGFTAVDALPDSDRGIGGHGSTGGILGR